MTKFYDSDDHVIESAAKTLLLDAEMEILSARHEFLMGWIKDRTDKAMAELGAGGDEDAWPISILSDLWLSESQAITGRQRELFEATR